MSFQLNGQFVGDGIIPDNTVGCDSLQVSFFPKIYPLGRWDTISSVRWQFGDGEVYLTDTAETVVHNYDNAGQYSVKMIINNNTTIPSNSQLFITVYNSPNAMFSYLDTAEVSTFTYVFRNVGQVDNSIDYFYQWFLPDSLIGSQPMLLHTFPEEQSYYLGLAVSTGELTNNLVCYDTVIQLIDVKDTLEVPNVFSPNGDNVNDFWIVKSNGMTTYSVRIFARTGTQIYQAEAPVIIWDGRNQSGQEMDADTYFYIIEPVKMPTRFRRTGYLQLFR